MSLRSNGSGDHLAVNSSLGISTGTFSFGMWVYVDTDRDTFSNIATFSDVEADPTDYINLATKADGLLLEVFSDEGAINMTVVTVAVGGWKWVVMGRTGTELTIRVFGDDASTTPETSDLDQTYAEDLSAHDWLVIGQSFAGEHSLMQFANAKLHVGVYWSDAQCRTESQNFGIQTAGGTAWGAWGFETLAHGVEGLQDLTGNGRTMVNTGCVDGPDRPTQLEAATSAGSAPMFRGS